MDSGEQHNAKRLSWQLSNMKIHKIATKRTMNKSKQEKWIEEDEKELVENDTEETKELCKEKARKETKQDGMENTL